MWARVVEFMLAMWLAISPFIFKYSGEETWAWVNDFTCSALISFFALICFYKPLRKMHLCNLIVSFWLIGLGFFHETVPMPGYLQNYVVIGLLLLMIDLVPSEANKPPFPWRDFYKSR